MIRRILVLLGGTPCDEKSAAAGVALGKRLGAHVEGLCIKVDPSEIMFRLGEGVAASAVDSIIETAQTASDESAKRGRATLEAAGRAAGMTIYDTVSDSVEPGVAFRHIQGPTIDVLNTYTSLADLVVFGEPGETAPVDLITKIEHTLISLRRPIIIARGDISPNLGDKILLPFNATSEACNALIHAAPLIAKSSETEILHLKEDGEEALVAPVTRALRYIKQHGGQATAEERAPSGKSIGLEIADRAQEIGADIVVMGGYGRSRWRELVLGGATRHMLHKSKIPVFLTH